VVQAAAGSGVLMSVTLARRLAVTSAVEERLSGAVESEHHVEALPGTVSIQVLSWPASAVGAKYMSDEPSAFVLSSS
jgi:hypothetical protein